MSGTYFKRILKSWLRIAENSWVATQRNHSMLAISVKTNHRWQQDIRMPNDLKDRTSETQKIDQWSNTRKTISVRSEIIYISEISSLTTFYPIKLLCFIDERAFLMKSFLFFWGTVKMYSLELAKFLRFRLFGDLRNNIYSLIEPAWIILNFVAEHPRRSSVSGQPAICAAFSSVCHYRDLCLEPWNNHVLQGAASLVSSPLHHLSIIPATNDY